MTTQPTTVTIAQALASHNSGLLVLDSAANIAAAAANAALLARVTSFTVTASAAAPASLTVAQMLALSGLASRLHAPAGSLALNSTAIVTVAQLSSLATLPGFILGHSANLTLSDTTAKIAALLINHPAYTAQVAAIAVHLDGTSIGAYAATQLNSLAQHKVLSFVPSAGYTTLNIAAAAHDLGSNEAALNALAGHQALSFTLTNEGATVVAGDAAGLASLAGFHVADHHLSVADTASNIAANAAHLFNQGFTQIQVVSGTLSGPAAELFDPTLHFAAGAHAVLGASATLNASGATTLAALPGISIASGVVLSVADTAANLLALSPAALALAGSVSLSADATLNVAQAGTLFAEPNFSAASHQITITDTAANLATLPPSAAALASAEVLAAPAAVSAATATSLAGLAHLSLAGNALTVQDSLTGLLGLSSPAASLATSLVLNVSTTASVAQITALAALPHLSLGGYSIAVTDSAANLLTLSGAALADAASLTLSADATMTAASFTSLRALPGIATGSHTITILDSAAHLATLGGSLSLAGSIALNASATVSATQIAAIAALPSFSLNGNVLGVADTAANLLALSAAALALAGSVSLSADATLNVAQAGTLFAEPNFSAASHQITITDTAANLATLPPSAAALASAEVLAAPATVSAATATSLAGLVHLSLAGNALTVQDSLTGLLGLSSPAASLATSLVLNVSATASVAQITALAALPHLSLGGYSIAVTDSAANLLTLSGAALADAASLTLSADATMTAASFTSLRALPGIATGSHTITILDSAAHLATLGGSLSLAGPIELNASATVSAAQIAGIAALPGFSLNGNALSVADTAANLLALSPAALALAGSVSLSADATLNVAQAATLFAEPNFSAASHQITITDTAANLATLPPSAAALASAEVLAAPATVSAATATSLAGLVHLSLAGNALTVQDSLTGLLGLSAPAATLATSLVLNVSATASVAQITALAALPHLSLGGYSIAVTDSAANLLTLSGAALADAASLTLSADATMTAASFTSLRALPGIATGSHTITILDSAAHLATLGGSLSLAGSIALNASATVSATQIAAIAALPGFSLNGNVLGVADTAANLLALSPAALALAGSVSLSADATLNVAQAGTLFAEPNFSAASHQITITDTAANLATLPPSAAALASAEVLAAPATVSAATVTSLAGLAHLSLAGNALTVQDSLTGLLGLSSPAASLATSLVLNVSTTASVAQITALAALPHLSLGGYSIAVTDSAANLLTLSGAALADAASLTLSADATMTAASFTSLRALPGIATGSHTITILDSAAHLATLGGSLSLAGSIALNASATVSATQIAAIAALPSFSLNGNVLGVADTAANLLALSAAALALAGSVSLSADATLNVAQAGTLFAEPNFSAASHQITITDTAANLATLPPSAAALASAEVLAAPATVSAATATSLAGLVHLSLAGNALTVQDSLTGLLGLSSPAASLATSLVLNVSATASVAQITALAALPHLSLGGYSIAVTDSAANLLTLSGAALADAASLTLSADATMTAASFTSLRALPGIATGSHTITILDSAAHLATLGGSLSLAGPIELNASATVSAAQIAGIAALPGFSLNGNALSVADTAANLLALSPAALALAGSVSLSADATLNVAQAATLFAEPNFSAASHQITITDTAANLATLPPSAAALASAEVLAAPATVSAATATSLAGLVHLSLAGNALTVQDTVPNLIALGHNALTLASLIQLAPGSTAIITAAQGHALSAIQSFSAAAASLVVADSVGHLTSLANSGWQTVAGATNVIDTAAALAAASATPLLQTAAVITLSANGQVSAAAAGQLASLPNFSVGNFGLTVSDTATAIAAHAAAIVQIATAAIVTNSAPITVQTANQLAAVSQAGLLSFQGGGQLTVQDSFSSLTDPANAPALALASRIGVFDTAANLVVASAHDWGGVNPSYSLAQPAIITGAQAITLAGLGTHFSAGAFGLSVADNAADVLVSAAALTSLHITADVHDAAASLGSSAGALLSLGSTLSAVHVTDSGNLSASDAAGVASLSAKLGTAVLIVVDNAANVNASIQGLASLSGHVAITVIDTAANVETVSSNLTILHDSLSISLVDTMPISASVAVGLLPVASNLVAGTSIAVSDTGAELATNATALAELGTKLGSIAASDGTTQDVATVASLAGLDSHFAPNVLFTGTGSGAQITAHLSALSQMLADNHLAAVVVSNTNASDATTNASALNQLPSQVSVVDNAANIDASISALSQVNGLNTISLTDNGTPVLVMNVGTLAANAAVLSKIASSFSITIADTAANIEADLASGNHSVITSHRTEIGLIQTAASQAITLTQGQVLATAVDDGAGSALSKFAGPTNVTNVDLAHLTDVAGLGHAPASIAVADTGAAISADLALAGSSALVNENGLVTSITSSDGHAVAVSSSQVLASGIDDGPTSLIALLHGAALSVTGATVSQLVALDSLNVPATDIAVADTAANLSADLASAGSHLVALSPVISAIHVQDGSAIILNEQQLLSADMDDGTHSLLSRVTGGSLAVTGVAASDLSLVLGLTVAPAQISISDSASNIENNFESVEANIDHISTITVTTGGGLILTADQALSAQVDDGTGSVLQALNGHLFDVTNSSVTQLVQVAALPCRPALVNVSDSSSNIVADLLSGTSQLASNTSMLGSVNVTGGTLTLTGTQAEFILSNPSLNAVMADLDSSTSVTVNGAALANLAGLAAAGWPHLSVRIADTPASLSADLASGTPSLLTNAALVGSVALDQSGTVNVATLNSIAQLPQFSTAGYGLAVRDGAAAIAGLGNLPLSLVNAVQVQDSDFNVAAQLDALQTKYVGMLSITLTDSSPSITLAASQYLADKATVDSITNAGALTVVGTAATLAPISSQLGSDPRVGHVQVTDSAANLLGSLGALQNAGGKLSVTLTDGSLGAALLASTLAIAGLTPTAIPVLDSGSQIAAVVEGGNSAAISYLNANGALLSSDSVVSATDAAALESLSGFQKNGHALQVWDTAAHLVAPSYASALGDNLIDSVHLRTYGGAAVVTAATASTLFSLGNFSPDNPDGSANTLSVSDSAQHIENYLATLTTNRSYIANVIVNASGTITDQILSDLRSLHAIEATAVNLVVRDTAADIAAGATAAASPGDIQPLTWALSGDGSVSENQAVVLGSLSNFSSGSYKVTISLNTDTTISLSDAASLGNIAHALSLNGHHLIVAGNAAQLSTLSPDAIGLITPALSDSLANIALLPANSPLLRGTVEITDSAPITATQAMAALSLVGTAIAPGSLAIDHMHQVVDSVANLKILTNSAAWSAYSALHSSFNLTAQDSVANLTNPSDIPFLSGLAQTSLPGDANISAAAAESLAAASPSIHFSQGTAHITITDNASNLLNPTNADGLVLGSTITLAGADQVDAAGCEQLLGIPRLSINTPLAVIDSSANLLDGVLGGVVSASPFSSHITVHLAGPETLDADTAESLVSIKGFAGGSDLQIADTSSYLLNSANLSAEQMANLVTLVGDETLSANLVLRLSELPHFTLGTTHVTLAVDDFADEAELKAIADDGANFLTGGHTISLNQDVLDLTPAEYTAVQTDNVVPQGHAIGVLPVSLSVTDSANTLAISASGIAGGTVHVYAADGSTLSSTVASQSHFNASVIDGGQGGNFSVTETVQGVEGAPLVVLDTAYLEAAVAQASSSFASGGSIQVDTGKFVNLYELGSVPVLTHAALVYDPIGHTISLNTPGAAPVPLITLGGSTHPASLDVSEFVFKHHG